MKTLGLKHMLKLIATFKTVDLMNTLGSEHMEHKDNIRYIKKKKYTKGERCAFQSNE